jgi:threonine dehydrogenase-like Zn-dependent dehydrogenase
MKAVVFRGIGDIRLEDVPEPKIEQKNDAVVRITASAICGTDLHMIRGTMPGMVPGTILGHEGVGIVEDVGSEVRNFKAGDRVIIPSTIGCGYCSYCRSGYFSQCDNANPNGKRAGTAFFGGPKTSGPFHGLQAEKARVPFANAGLVKLPDNVSDDQAILLSDIFPTGYYGAALAEIKHGDTIAVFGCGPVGQFAILSAFLLGAGRVIAVDRIDERLQMAQSQGAEIINFEVDDPVEAILELTGGIGVDRVIDAVGVDAEAPHKGPAARQAESKKEEFERELHQIAPETHPQGKLWVPGDAPSQALAWEVECLAKAGTLSIIGVYPQTVEFFPLGQAMMKNITINMGNCNHRKYIPKLLDMVKNGTVDPQRIITQTEAMPSAIDAYKAFDERKAGWLKVELLPQEEFAEVR